jgi:hypothetical protein
MAVAKTTKVKATKKKRRKRQTSPPPVVETMAIPTRQSWEVESEEEEEAIEEPLVMEDRSTRRLLSPAANRQWELAEKTTEDASVKAWRCNELSLQRRQRCLC